jgi:hypothetical protein
MASSSIAVGDRDVAVAVDVPSVRSSISKASDLSGGAHAATTYAVLRFRSEEHSARDGADSALEIQGRRRFQEAR